ncbi:MAG: hypothetical protein KC996_00235, partial [Phycisphaerales bacterium]|nr:hypothetical protein [Phycisphaerales bacterium]
MKLKNYTAPTMAEALAQVRKDLGRDAMILHTRTYRVGSWLGLGGKTMVEITASAPEAGAVKPQRRAMPTVQPTRHSTPPAQQPEIVVQRSEIAPRARLRVGAPASDGNVGLQSPRPTRDEDGLAGRDALFGGESIKPRDSRRPVRAPRIINTTQQPSSADIADAREALIARKDRGIKDQTPSKPAAPKPEQPSKPTASDPTNDELRAQIASMQKMMGQVLETTRKTAISVGRHDSEAMLPTGEMPAPLMAQYTKMIDNDVPVDVADRIVGKVRDRLDAGELADMTVVRQALLREIELTIDTRSESLLTVAAGGGAIGRPRVIALIGPTGVGKTTTVAKLAATYKLRHHKKVGLITSDTYRIAAV